MHEFAIAGIIKDEEETIPWFLENIAFLKKHGLVNITWVDTGSSDGTCDVVRRFQKDYVVPIHLYHRPFTDYGATRTWALRLAPVQVPWLFVLDPDELVLEEECGDIQEILSDAVELWYVKRKKWGDLAMTDQRETYAYPDWQCRFARNRPHVHYNGKVHEMIQAHNHKYYQGGLHIHHFEPVWRSPQRLHSKYRVYRSLGLHESRKSEFIPTVMEVFDPNKGIKDFKWHSSLSKYFVPGMTEHGYPDYNWEYDFVRRHLPPAPCAIIDAGGGTGTMQIHLTKIGYAVHNVDHDPKIMEKIRKINSRFNTNIRAYNTPLSQIPGPDDIADAIISVSVLEHNTPEELAKIIPELVRKLKPGGRLIATIPVVAQDPDHWDPRTYPLWRWRPEKLREAFQHPQLQPLPSIEIDAAKAKWLAAHYPGTRHLYPLGLCMEKLPK